MKLEEFQRMCAFLCSQGIEPDLDMLRLEAPELERLLDLTEQWEELQKELITQPTLTDVEIEEEKENERIALLYHSSG